MGRSIPADYPGINLTYAYRNGDEILAGTRAFPTIRRPSERYPVQCKQCPCTWLIGDTQREAADLLRAHQQEHHPRSETKVTPL
jgi:hypothetical protein